MLSPLFRKVSMICLASIDDIERVLTSANSVRDLLPLQISRQLNTAEECTVPFFSSFFHS